MEKKQGFNWTYFLLGLIFIVVSLISFRDPESSLIAIVYVFAIAAILKGVFELFFKRTAHNMSKYHFVETIIVGVFDLIVGIFLLYNVSTGLIALPFIFAIWFIVDSLLALFTAGIYKNNSKGYYWFTLILSLVGILIGVSLLFNPLSSLLTLAFLVGFYFMLNGITLLIYSF